MRLFKPTLEAGTVVHIVVDALGVVIGVYRLLAAAALFAHDGGSWGLMRDWLGLMCKRRGDFTGCGA